MLSDQVTQLLTAFVDGELTPREREAVLRLLNKSSEAREFLKQLQEDAHRLKQLPKHKVEPSLVEEIVQAIAEQKAQQKSGIRQRYSRRPWLPYVAAGLAASLLVAAISLAYWAAMGNWNDVEKEQTPFVENKLPEKLPEPQPAPPKPAPRKAPPLMDQLVKGTFAEFSKPVPEDLPFAARFAELQQGAKLGQLAHELNQKKAVEFDVKVTSGLIAMERLKSALHSQKITVIQDPSAAKALTDAAKATKENKIPAKVEYLVYVENLTTDELARMMKDLSLNDTTGMGGSRPSPYDKVIVKPIAPRDTQKVAGLLGIDAAKLELPKAGKPEPTPDWARKVVVLPVGPANQPSAQMRQFVAERGPQPGTVRVLIKIHE